MDFSADQLLLDFDGVRIEQIAPDGRNLIFFAGSAAIILDNPVQVNILSEGNVIAQGDAMIHVAPAIRIEPSKSLSPDEVLPDGDKRIRIDIKIEGVEDQP